MTAVGYKVSIGDIAMLKTVLPILFKLRPTMVYEIIRKQLADSVPFAKHCSVELQSIGDARAEARLPERPELMNHIGSQHAAAMFALAETASGGAMAGAFAPILLTVRPVAAEARIQYLKVAKGPLTALATIEEDGATLRARMETDGKVRFPVRVDIRDQAGESVAAMTVEWYVSPKRA